MRQTLSYICLAVLLSLISWNAVAADCITNVYGRDIHLLNGKWDAIIDPYDDGYNKQLWIERTPQAPHEFFEYRFDGGLRLDVPGDWNSQQANLEYYEGTVWYARHFTAGGSSGIEIKDGSRNFLYFGAVSSRCEVWLNGQKVAGHEGSFTPFETDVTGLLQKGDNFLVLAVSNRRSVDAIPAMKFDWWNYGGITRDVMLVSVPKTYIRDYFVRLDPVRNDTIVADIELSEPVSATVLVEIPDLGISQKVDTDSNGRGRLSIRTKKLKLWNSEDPVLYSVHLSCGEDAVEDEIGFRRIAVDGARILLNGRPTFMRCISFHEEIPQRMGRAYSESDARLLLGEAQALGVNMVRLAHYPQNEYTVRLAEKMGILLWEEIPIWQGIDFEDPATYAKASTMLREMIMRDRNRCAIGFWSISNETRPSARRDDFLTRLLAEGRALDSSRLFTSAFDVVYYREESGLFEMHDDFPALLDVIGINKYMGWYAPWPKDPEKCVWNVYPDKPLIVSEFGGEALYGRRGDSREAASWSEDYQLQLYRDNLAMFENIPNLAGVSPWILFDFRSPYRFLARLQDGWNRKGLVSDKGQRKAAWYLMHDYYMGKKNYYENNNKN